MSYYDIPREHAPCGHRAMRRAALCMLTRLGVGGGNLVQAQLRAHTTRKPPRQADFPIPKYLDLTQALRLRDSAISTGGITQH
jgi:hypothetical protein